jgi:hypothetical protein
MGVAGLYFLPACHKKTFQERPMQLRHQTVLTALLAAGLLAVGSCSMQPPTSKTLQAKGHRYSAVPGEGDLLVSYHVALADAPAIRESTDTNDFQLQPGLNMSSPDPARYEKGTPVIKVSDGSTGLAAWRSALQGFVVRDPGATERRQRIGLMVDRMLAGMPAK